MKRLVVTALLVSMACVPTEERTGQVAQAADVPSFPTSADDPRSFTLAETREFRADFEEPFTAWTAGGDLSRYVFLNMSEFWPAILLSNTGEPLELLEAHDERVANLPVTVEGGETTVSQYVRNSPTDGVVVVHDGRIVFEDYPRMLPTDKHIWFSVSKTFVSTAVAILEDRGQVEADRPIDAYISELAGTAWAGTPVVDIVDMASGIDCPEVKSDPDSCFWEFYHGFGWPVTDLVREDAMGLVPAMARLRPSGEVFDYTSVNTEVLNWLVEVVSGERFSDFVEREIWQRTGAESDAFITTTANGAAFSAGGVSSNLRDLARYGMLFSPMGRRGPSPVVSDQYLDKILNGGRPALASPETLRMRERILGDSSARHNSYQWDIVTEDGDFFKGGFGGQGLYVSPSRDLVVVWFGTHSPEGGNEMLRVARQIATSGVIP